MNRLALRGSLRIRLLAGTVFWVAASIIVAGWGLGSLFRQHVAKQFHAELQTHLDQLTAHLALDEQGRPTLSMPLSDLRLNRPYSGLYWQIDDLAGAGAAAVGTLRSRPLWDYVLTAPVDAPADGEVHRYRLSGPAGTMLGIIERSVRLDDRPEVAAREFRLIVAADERLMVEPAARVNGALWLALGVLATGLVIAALVQVFVGLSPLRTLRAALGRVRNGDAQRLEGEFPVEIAPLVGEFNSVLEQNAEVVQRARTQAGNLAHALKTPLSLFANAAAGGDGELARLVIAPRSMPRKNRCTTTWRGPRRLPGARTALRPVFERLLRTMRRIHAGRQLELLLHPLAESLAFRGEEQDLQEMLGNLLDNACKWATARVEIQASVDGENLMIRVDDDGQGIAAAARDAVLCRGVAPTSRCRDPGWACRLSTIWRSSTAANSDWPIRRSVACRQC